MSNRIISLVVGLVSLVSVTASAQNRHEFRDYSSKSRSALYLNSGLDCAAPMVVFSAQSVIVTRDADIKLTRQEVAKLTLSVEKNGSALVCSNGSELFIF
jgi:hypothetical protein